VPRLFLPALSELRRLGKSEEHNLFAGEGADVVMQAARLDARNAINQCFQGRPSGFNKLGSYLLQQVATLLSRKRLHQVLLGSGQNTLQANHDQVADQVGMNVLGAAAHEFLLKPRHSLADGRFDLSLRFHADRESLAQLFRNPHTEHPGLGDGKDCLT